MGRRDWEWRWLHGVVHSTTPRFDRAPFVRSAESRGEEGGGFDQAGEGKYRNGC